VILNHQLKVKVGEPTMLLRNIDQRNDFYDGTRLQANYLDKFFISTTLNRRKTLMIKYLYQK